jgi:hypothetical protein
MGSDNVASQVIGRIYGCVNPRSAQVERSQSDATIRCQPRKDVLTGPCFSGCLCVWAPPTQSITVGSTQERLALRRKDMRMVRRVCCGISESMPLRAQACLRDSPPAEGRVDQQQLRCDLRCHHILMTGKNICRKGRPY